MSERFARLLPGAAEGLTAQDVAAAALPASPPPGDGRPFVLANMIATADGRVTIAGRAGPIANRADYELLHALRARADAVMIGAQTVRVEGYGPMEQLAVLMTRTADLAPDTGLLAAPGNRIAVLTPSPDAELPPCAAAVTYLRGSLADGLRRLRGELGVRAVVCEGGPAVLGDLVRAGLVDELQLVLAPTLAGGDEPLTVLSGAELDPPAALELRSLHASGGYLFARYGLLSR